MLEIKPLKTTDYSLANVIEQRSNRHPWTDTALLSQCQSSETLGLYLNKQLSAFVLFQTVVDEAEILHLVCDKKQQDKGYAKKLLQAMIKQLQLQGIKLISLEVRHSNSTAKHLYQQLGFSEVGVRQAYYKDGEDALIMQLIT